MKTEKQKMLAGEIYSTRDDTLMVMHHKARDLLKAYNATQSQDISLRHDILSELLGQCAEGVWIEPPFYCDYGENIQIDAGVFVNFNCVFLDSHEIHIGVGTLLGPSVQIYTPTHPLSPSARVHEERGRVQYTTQAKPVHIGEKCWIGGNSVILPGVTIGSGTTIAAGSVVTRSIPANVLAGGNPCRILREIADNP